MLVSSTLSFEPTVANRVHAAARWKEFRVSRLGLATFAATACLVGLGYSLYTQQIWEDSLITLRHSENLLNGNGLTYNPSERVHGFTSPINVLLLAVCHLLTGQSSYIATCWLYRSFTIAAFAGSGVLLLRASLAMMPRWTPAVWFVAIMYLFDGKSVAFSTNGMETAFMLLFVSWAIYLLTLDSTDCWLPRGLCWGGLMWTRPDGCVYIAVLTLAQLLFSRDRPWRDTLQSLAKSAGLGALVYGPWFLWAWWYYGSPIPHTVIAKSNIDEGAFTQLLRTLDNLLTRSCLEAANVFRPIYYGEAAGWIPQPAGARMVNGITKVAGVFCLFYWILPTGDRWGRMASFCFAAMCLYFSCMQMPYPWYYAPVFPLGLIALGRGLTQLAGFTRERLTEPARLRHRAILACAVIVLLSLTQIMLLGLTAYKGRIQQVEIELGNRSVIGTWLKEHGRPEETVYLEPLGYIGYFSGLKMVDYPGLVSPDVVRIRKEKRVDRITLIPELHPDWVVLRFSEVQYLLSSPIADQFQKEYALVHQRDVNDRLSEYGPFNDHGLRYDAAYAVFRRNSPTVGTPTSEPRTSAPVMPPIN